jgi:deoxyadenosine/deoxycytidine kinase
VLIVISGPIASGKSTVAHALARECERRALTAAITTDSTGAEETARKIADWALPSEPPR